ncbi:MAG: site-2 protease family protein [Chthonomonadales bacterium]|nr:site-2 protease family protein [Chthonomonadales bacterium]
MKWSWRLGEYAGIAVYMHATFLLLIAWVAISHLASGDTLRGALGGIAFILALFGCVLLHEFGHALAARRYGIKTRDITLLPIGGVARLERMPDDPRQELVVALAGPAVNVVIAAALLIWLIVTSTLSPFGSVGVASGPFIERLLIVNVILVLFNMIPAFPMDGGRVVRALLAMRMEYTRATQTAANLGQGLAMLFGLFGLLTGHFMLLFIAFFVWIGAAQEASMVQMKSALGGIPVSRAMLTNFETVSPTDPLQKPVDLLLQGFQQDFPVLWGNELIGVLTRSDLISGLSQRGPNATVQEVMRRDFQIADPHDMLETAFMRLQECQCHTLPVVRSGEVVGLLTSDNLGEFMMVQSALAARPGSAG